MTCRLFLCFPMWLVLELFTTPARAADPKPTPSSLPRLYYAIYQATCKSKHSSGFSVTRAHIDPKTKRSIASGAHTYPYDINGTDIFTLSPDGSKLVVSINRVNAFAWMTPADRKDERYANLQSVLDDLAVFDLTTGARKRLTRDNAGYTDVVWSSDSESIAYVSARGVDLSNPSEPRQPEWRVYVQNVRTGKRHTVFQEQHVAKNNLRQDSHLLRWLPDSHHLLYISNDPAGLFLLDTRGGKPVLLSEHIPDTIALGKSRIVWVDNKLSVDNKTFLSATLHTAQLPADLSMIKTAKQWSRLPGTLMLSLPFGVVNIAVSPDGGRIAVPHGDPANNLMSPVVIDAVNHTVTLIGSFDPVGDSLSWSQNGRFLLYSQREYYNPGKGNKLIAFPATGGMRQPWAKVNWKLPVAPLKTTVILDLPEAKTLPFVWQEAK